MTVVLAILGVLATLALGVWDVPGGWAASQLVWLAPLAWLVGVGAAVAAVSGNGRAGAVVVGGLWIAEAAFPAWWVGGPLEPLYLFANGRVPAAPYTVADALTEAWLQDRIALLAAAALLIVTAWVSLRGTERLLGRRRDDTLRAMRAATCQELVRPLRRWPRRLGVSALAALPLLVDPPPGQRFDSRSWRLA